MAIVQVPQERIGPDTLERLVEEFVTRDGTDYGEQERTLEQKKSAVLRQIEYGEVVIVFDPETETINLISKDDLELALKKNQ